MKALSQVFSLFVQTEVNALSDAIGTCLDWVAESQLKQNVLTLVKSGANDNLENDIGIEISSEKSFKVNAVL